MLLSERLPLNEAEYLDEIAQIKRKLRAMTTDELRDLNNFLNLCDYYTTEPAIIIEWALVKSELRMRDVMKLNPNRFLHMGKPE